MCLNRRLLVVSLGIVVALAILAGGAVILNKWSSQPANSPPSAGNSPGSAEDDPIDLPETGLVQLTTPVSSISYYLKSMNSLVDLGIALGTYDLNNSGKQDHLVILDYGYPDWRAQGEEFEYGVQLVDDVTQQFQTMADVTSSAVNFAKEYYLAVHDIDSFSHLRMVIGVNNCCWYETGLYDRFAGHGQAWADTINSIQSQISDYASQVDVIAGMDIEQSNPERGGDPYATYLWLNAYKDHSNCTPTQGMDNTVEGCFYNFGTMNALISPDLCHTSEPSDPHDPNYKWNSCDVWYVSWGVEKNSRRFARPVPEIYHGYASMPPWGSDAMAWKALSSFSNDQKSAGPMFFVGTLTQRLSCNDACKEGNNYSWEGFQLLSRALASDTTIRQAMHWTTDITHLQH